METPETRPKDLPTFNLTLLEFRASESGQGILEYAMIFSFVVLLLVVLLYLFGNQVELTYQSILDSLPF
jgi:Flp pilus assembly pilin Flp